MNRLDAHCSKGLEIGYSGLRDGREKDFAMKSNDTRVVVVAGDISVHHHLYVRSTPLDLWEPFGAITVEELLRKVANARLETDWGVQLAVRQPDLKGALFDDDYKHGYSLFRPHSRNGKDTRKVWRAEGEIAYGKTEFSFKPDILSPSDTSPKFTATENPDVILLYDIGHGFWEKNRHDLLVRLRSQRLRWIVLKMSQQKPSDSSLWNELSATYSDRLICVTSAYKLRKFIDLPKALSWQQAVDDLRRRWFSDRAYETLVELRQCRHLIVTYSTDGAIWLDLSDKNTPVATLIYDPFGVESAFINSFEGEMPGYEIPITSAIALGLIESGSDEKQPLLVPHIKRGLATLRNLLVDGHGDATPESHEPSGFPAARIATALMGPYEKEFADTEVFWNNINEKQRWSPWAVIDVAKQQNEVTDELRNLARDVLLKGEGALQGYPQARFGDMKTIDRYEVEKLSALRRQLNEYQRRRSTQPYSIGVFGPPGAGKSFGVSQIAAELFGGDAWLSFNLAQFGSPGDLIGALHQVRDHALGGLTPVVFWDEFDSQSLIWLKYFLAPMQDGRFQEGQVTHRIGKCVFVFAGGIFYTYEEFSEQDSSTKSGQAFAAAKGPDFVGRLDFAYDIAGPNERKIMTRLKREAKQSENAQARYERPRDLYFPLRRALMIRRSLGLNPDEPAPIDDGGLVDALLEVPRYRHGSRSLDKLVRGLRREKGTLLNSGALPDDDRLWMLVDDLVEFYGLLARDKKRH